MTGLTNQAPTLCHSLKGKATRRTHGEDIYFERILGVFEGKKKMVALADNYSVASFGAFDNFYRICGCSAICLYVVLI